KNERSTQDSQACRPVSGAHFFQEASHERSLLDNDYALPVLNNSPDREYPFFTNIFQRHNDLALIFHFPCSLGCKKSIELGKRHLSIASGIIDAEKLKGKIRAHGRDLRFI
ncbi:MAG: hypothetical protein HGA85_08960, partial [Nanoarchaeota archaeon]|nr:hypothetical protein [Nanoarchaeota archaeon]